MESPLLVVGLGNPDREYVLTRHNIGFMVADRTAEKFSDNRWQEKFLGHFCSVNIGDVRVFMLKPQTYMNRSGRSVQRAAEFYKVEIGHIIVIHDDVDLEFGCVRIKKGGGTGGHKGIASCKKQLGNDAGFLRVRIGVGRPRFGDTSDYVLSAFSSDEQIELGGIVDRASEAVESIIVNGVVKSMNTFNRRQGDNDE